jgi:hypothetical protein
MRTIFKMGIIIQKKNGAILRTCPKNQHRQFSKKNENRPTLVTTWLPRELEPNGKVFPRGTNTYTQKVIHSSSLFTSS